MPEDKKPTICRLIFEFLPTRTGGSVIHTIELSKHINPYCKRQLILVPEANEDTAELDKSFPFEIYRVKYLKFKLLHRLKAKYFKWLPLAPFVVLSYGIFALPLILRLNRKYNIDIIHAHGVSIGAIATVAGIMLRKPVVWMIHGSTQAYSNLSRHYETVVTRLFKPDHAIILDDGSAAPTKFVKLLGSMRGTIVKHAIDTEFYHPISGNDALSRTLELDGKFVILSAHSLIPVKGIEHAISAFGELLGMCGSSNAILIIVGDGKLRKQLEELAYDLGISEKVLFLGRIENPKISDYLSIADISVATSTYSNVNRSVQEAMACGKPVVAFNSGGTAKIIQHMETGLLAEVGNVRDFARQMLLLYQNPKLRVKIGDNARKFIVQSRSWENRINTELTIYEKLLQGKIT